MSRALNSLVRIGLLLALASVVVTAVGMAVAPQLTGLTEAAHGEAGEIELRGLSQRSYVYAADGTLIATLQEEENRAPVALDEVPDHVVDAVLAVEDSGFWEHKGVNVRATVRALLSNVEAGGTSQGGSTITQQLIKQSVLSSEQTFDRKTREVFLAVRLEEQMSKEEILERYLNTIYLGNHSYGIQTAAETYFGVSVGELDPGQAALLAGMIRDPIDYNPFVYPEVAVERRRIALSRMVAEGIIPEDAAALYGQVPLPTEPTQYTPPPDDYFVEEVKQALLADPRLGETATERYDAVFRGGLQIHTTLDPGSSPPRSPPATRPSPRSPSKGSPPCSPPGATWPASTPSARWRPPRSSRRRARSGRSSAVRASATSTSSTSPRRATASPVRRSRPSCCSSCSSRATRPRTPSRAAGRAGSGSRASPSRTR